MVMSNNVECRGLATILYLGFKMQDYEVRAIRTAF
jgi:hypothetical protein